MPVVVTLAGGYARRVEDTVEIHAATIEEAIGSSGSDGRRLNENGNGERDGERLTRDGSAPLNGTT